MLQDKYSINFIHQSLVDLERWKPFPRASDRKKWAGLLKFPLNKKRKKFIIESAEKILKEPCTVIPLSRYFDYIRTGDRQAFQNLYMKRRQNLAALVLASCFAYEQKYIEAVADLMWTICEESTWAISAHADRKNINGKLDLVPDISRKTLELFSCETAAVLAETIYLLEDELNQLSPSIVERVKNEIETRILKEFETRDDFVWLTFHNNWKTWCISSIFIAASYVIKDRLRLAKLYHRGLGMLKPYLEHYPKDFSCDEGPRYWSSSAGALFLILETLYLNSEGKLYFYDEPAIIAMGKYLADMHLCGPYFFNYADSTPKMDGSPSKMYRYGERIKDERLKNLALLSLKKWDIKSESRVDLNIGTLCGDLLEALRILFWIPPDAKIKKIPYPLCVWYHVGQLLIARETTKQNKGFILTVKGGHNGESHNHNDVGHFSIYCDDEPVIVDPGCGTYRRQSFSKDRYKIWYNSARGHDLLQFDDHEQATGDNYKAEIISFENTKTYSLLEMDLSKTFAPDAGLIFWKRKFEIHRAPNPKITVIDSFETKSPCKVSFPIFTPIKPELKNGKATFKLKNGRKVQIIWDSEVLSARMVLFDTEEDNLDVFWGAILNRIVFSFKGKRKTGSSKISIF